MSHLLYQTRNSRQQLTVDHPDHGELSMTLTDTPLVWHVHDSDGMRIFLLEMLFNWRITLSHQDALYSYEGGWCYSGKDYPTFLRALHAAHAFDPATSAAPDNYDKQVLDWDPRRAGTTPRL